MMHVVPRQPLNEGFQIKICLGGQEDATGKKVAMTGMNVHIGGVVEISFFQTSTKGGSRANIFR